MSGACKGPITIARDDLKIRAINNSTSITATNANVVTASGATGIEFDGFTISGGNNGFVIQNNGSVLFRGTTVTGNTAIGVQVVGDSFGHHQPVFLHQ